MSLNRPHWRTEWMVALAFIALIPSLVGLYFVDKARRDTDRKARAAIVVAFEKANEKLAEAQAKDAWSRYDDALKACERGRELRTQQNANIEIAERLAFIVAAVFSDGAIDQIQEGIAKRAGELRDARDRIAREALKLKPLSQPVCKTVIKHPTVPRPSPQPRRSQ